MAQNEASLWIYPTKNPEFVKAVIDEFRIHPITAQVLVSRGYSTLEEIHSFLYAKLPDLFDPDLFQDIDKAVDRVCSALQRKEPILIYGDNDVDGITAAALLVEFFRELQTPVFVYIPNRSTIKKSLVGEALDFAISNRCTLLITVDCGITAAEEIKEVVGKGIDVIVTDHHEPTSKIPNCIATLNPKLLNSVYPNRDLTGVGVAFKLAHAVLHRLIEDEKIGPDQIDLKNYLDLVALGTIADMGALRSENRILVRYGLKQMQLRKRVGLAKLLDVSDMQSKEITPVELASKVAPRLNSLGRVADPIKGVELLLIRDPEEAESLAKELDLFNTERQRIEREVSEEIDETIARDPSILNERAVVLHSKNWHSGVIAIVTTRIAKQYNRPAVVISVEQGIGKGSIRTISEFPLLAVLKELEGLLINYGGHDFAAGLTIEEESIPLFKKKFLERAEYCLREQDLIPKLFLDAPAQLNELTFDLIESLNLLEPFGNGNPVPLLYCDTVQTWPPKVVGKIHLKLFLEQQGRVLEGIGFNLAGRKAEIQKGNIPLRVVFTPQVNMFLNKPSIQLHVKDFKVI